MELNSVYIMSFIWPAVRTIVWAIFGVGGTIALGYYLFVVRRRRLWNVDIYEPKAGGHLHLIDKDKVVEKKISGGVSLFVLRKKNIEVLPPPSSVTYRLKGKEYANYLRQDNEYVPLEEKQEEFKADDKLNIFQKVKKTLTEIRNSPREEIEKKYIYRPFDRQLTGSVQFTPMDYDVNLLRITSLETRQKAYQDKQTFLQKWGALIGIGTVAVLLIVALYI